MRAVLREVLQARDHSVEAFAGADEALAAFLRQPAELLVVDWVLQGMDGLELCRRVRASPGGSDAVILVITSRDQPEHLAAVLDAGASDYVAKPFDRALLETRLTVAERRASELAERRRAQAGRETSEARFQALIHAIPDLMFRVDRQGRYLDAFAGGNQEFFKPREQFLGRTIEEVLPANVARRAREGLDATLASGAPSFMAYQLPMGGVARDYEARIVRSGPDEAVIIVREVTHEKRLEARLQTSQRLAATGTIAAGMAHEINNPLAAITANLDFVGAEVTALDRTLEADRLRDVRAALDDMREAAGRVARVVDDLKTFSRVDDDRLVPVDVAEVLEAALGVAGNQIRHRARLTTELGAAPPVLANESRLGQVFLNLLVNAAEAIRVGDADHNEIRVALRPDAAGALIEVSDTGCGIDPSLRGRIFDAFFTTKPVGEGMGLGLSVCHAIVSSLGGSIEVESELGKGSSFRVRLPQAPERQALRTLPAPPPSLVVPERPRLLLVDDEPTILRSLLRLLRDYECTVARSGREALELIESGAAFELILCDLMMPELTGMDLYEALVARGDALHERVVFMTGGAFTARARQFLDSVPNERIDKPFDAEHVRSLVKARTGGAAA
jgi:signal transduction histidine kinase